MPLYEYRCDSCGFRFERIERPSSPTARACPQCEHEAKRLLGVPALQFKGSGWYVTDYGRGSAQSPPADTESTTESTSTQSTADTTAKSQETAAAPV
jgi:putative FmdB family regulatory protein